MPKDYVEIATKGHPLMAFWTLAAMGYIFQSGPTVYKAIYLFVTIGTATIAYNELNRLFDAIQKLGGKYSRGRWGNQSKQKCVKNLFYELLSNNELGWGQFVVAINTIIAVLIYFYYIIPHIVSENPDQIIIGFFILPLIWIFTLLWTASELVTN